jgi:outer membrane protein assembly factor BamB
LTVLDPFGDEEPGVGAPDRSVFTGPEDRRLPRTATELWTFDIDGVGEYWIEVIDRELVVIAADTTLVALDALTGDERWSLMEAEPMEVAVVGALDDVLVIERRGESGSTVVGIDMATGETRWSTDAEPNDGHVGLIGTRFVARLPSSPDRLVKLIDASSGREVGTIESDPSADGRPGGWATDGRGTWVTIVDGEVLLFDLGDEFAAGQTVGSFDGGAVTPVVVGDRLVAVDTAGSLVLIGADRRSTDVGSAVAGPARSLTPVSDERFVVTTPGSIAGLALDGDTVTVEWQRDGGAEVGFHPVDGGALLQVATRGGAAMALGDASTGETIEQLVMVPGALQALEVAGDGYMVLRRAAIGTRVTAIGLDGTERWSILGPEPVHVGDRVVVRATSIASTDDGGANDTSPTRRVEVYGDSE